MPHHDLVIIGSGSGNSLLTPELEGLDVAIIEGGTFGGTCVNVGCIPTKMFVVPADRVLEAADSTRLGITFAEPTVDWPGLRDRIFGRVDLISAGGRDYRLGQDRVTLYEAHATFTGERRLSLSTGEQLTADRVVVASGSRPLGLDVEGLHAPNPGRGLHTSDTVMRLDRLPARMTVIGGGYVACELAHVFSALGVAVTQVQRSATLLRYEEVEVSQRYTDVARRRYDLRLSTVPTSAQEVDGTWRIGLDGPGGPSHVEAEVVLLAVGRRPNTDLLGSVAGGLECHDDGRLVVDAEQRTTSPGVWALGDTARSTSSRTWRTTRRASSRTTWRSTPAGSREGHARTTVGPFPTPSSGTRRWRPSGRPPRSWTPPGSPSSARRSRWATSPTAGRSRTPPGC